MNELAQTLSTLGHDPLITFVVIRGIDDLVFVAFLSLAAWGIRVLYKDIKSGVFKI